MIFSTLTLRNLQTLGDTDLRRLEEKLETLIREIQKSQDQNSRDRLFSKIDGLFYVFITLSTFISGLTIANLPSLIRPEMSGLLFPLVLASLSLVTSFTVGFKGMINDSIETRFLAWSLLILCFFTLACFSCTSAIYLALPENNVLRPWLGFLGGFVSPFFAMLFSSKTIHWIEAKFTILLREKIAVWSERFSNRVFKYYVAIFLLTLLATIITSEITKLLL